MTAQELKSHIYINGLIENVLSELRCHHIKKHDGFYTCGNPDGDNKSAIVVYENENITTLNYTRQLTKQQRPTDIFDLVALIKQCTFPESIREICNMLGLDYYQEAKEMPEFLYWLQYYKDIKIEKEQEDTTPLKPISEDILSYYLPYGNIMFEQDNIPLDIQKEFNVGYDPATNYITIPIYDELGTLVGVKGRFFGENDGVHTKYTYLESCNKSRILYGYFQNKDNIKSSDRVFVVESEKAVMQLAGMGFRNAVSTGGKTISKHQVELISRTSSSPVFAYDADVTEDELSNIANMFVDGIKVYAIIDKDGILSEKESPSDNTDNWAKLLKNHIYQIK